MTLLRLMPAELDLEADAAPIGEKARRAPNLRLVPAQLELDEQWEILPGVPRTRGECPTARPCPFLKCRYHLWLVEAESRPGRRHQQGGAPETALQPNTMASCALDIADTGEKLTFEQVGLLLGVSDERIRKIFEQTKAKIEALGYSLEDLLTGDAR